MATTRRDFLAAVTSAVAAPVVRVTPFDAQRGSRRDVPWLHEVLVRPASVPAPPRPLQPLLVDGKGNAIRSRGEWERRRGELERIWRDVLGRLEVERGRPPHVHVIAEDRVDGVVRQHVRYEVEPGVETEAYVLTPGIARGRRAGAIVFHTTTPESIRQPAGLADVREKRFGMALARRGFVAFCPRNFLWPETARLAAKEETARFQQRHPRARGMAKMLFDGQVALDALIARADVDRSRIACIGHSLGAKEALYLAAFDRRVTAVVSSEGGIGMTMSNWDAAWYLGPLARDLTSPREHHELLALAAPRPFLLVGGDSADGAASWPWIEAALPVYRLYSEPPRLGLLNHQGGHAVPPHVEPRLIEWLETYV